MTVHARVEHRYYRPAIQGQGVRIVLALMALAGGTALTLPPEASVWTVTGLALAAWAVSTWLTDKYRHKYPQRYYQYVLASHGKAAIVTAVVLAPVGVITALREDWLATVIVSGLVLAVDLLLSLPRRRMSPSLFEPTPATATTAPAAPHRAPPLSVRTSAIVASVRSTPPGDLDADGLARLLAETLPDEPNGDVTCAVVDGDLADQAVASESAFLLHLPRMNAVRRFNLTLQELTGRVAMGGLLALRYQPLDEELEALRARDRGRFASLRYFLHFLWYRGLPKLPVLEKVYFSASFAWLDALVYRRTKKRRRVISRAEMWGRVYFWGFELITERKIGTDHWVLARRTQPAEAQRKPSFFLVARLSKVGLFGHPMHLHKLRTMYPFSEFIQAKIHQDHGLSNTGKFRDDFRLTDYGRWLRKYWLDEIPQLYDWLRGEIKLVGMRATSPHFLSLYPRELYDLYIQTKPGLVPPIFDANTSGFEDITRIELEYLRAYQERPFATDVRCLFTTLHDIFVRGVRSK